MKFSFIRNLLGHPSLSKSWDFFRQIAMFVLISLSNQSIFTWKNYLFLKSIFFSVKSTCFTKNFSIAEVARTRLREENSVYRSFWQTLFTVYKNEGRRGLYRGLVTQLIRQIPNTAIMMSTYELTVYVLTKWLKEPQKISHNSSWQLKRDPPGDDDKQTSSQQK